jgi:hypothetical protein
VRSNSFHPRESNLLLWELIKTLHASTKTLDYSFGYHHNISDVVTLIMNLFSCVFPYN